MTEIKAMRTPRNRKALAAFAELLAPDSIMVEIGSHIGESACIFAPHVKTLICIDPWPGRDDIRTEFMKNTAHLPNVNTLRMPSVEAAALFSIRSIDVLYVDGLHDEDSVRHDLSAWEPKVFLNGILAGHDYGDHAPGVIAAVKTYFGKEPASIFGDTSWLM